MRKCKQGDVASGLTCRWPSVVLAAVMALLPGMTGATEPLFSCRLGPVIASGLRPGDGNEFIVLRKTQSNGTIVETPIIAYYNLPAPNTNFAPDAGLYLRTCDDADCSSGTTQKVEGSTATYSVDLSVVLQGTEQLAVIASYNRDTAAPGIRQYYCNDRTCTKPTILRRTTGEELAPQLTLSPGERPFIAFGSHRPDGLGIDPVNLVTCRCADALCNPLPTCHPINDLQDNGWYPAVLWRGDERPALIAHGGTEAAVFECTDMNCSGGVNHTIGAIPAGSSALYTNISLRPGGRALVTYAAFRSNDAGIPMLAACTTENCAGETARALDTTERRLRIVHTTMRPNGRALVTWGEEAGPGAALRFYQCANQDCTDGRTGEVVASPEVGHALAMRSDGVAVIAFRPFRAGTVQLAFCGLPSDLIFTDDFDPL